MIYNVSLAFYANAAAQARLATAAKSLRDAEQVQAAAEDRYKRGIGTVVEVAQAKQATAEARLTRVQAEGSAPFYEFFTSGGEFRAVEKPETLATAMSK